MTDDDFNHFDLGILQCLSLCFNTGTFVSWARCFRGVEHTNNFEQTLARCPASKKYTKGSGLEPATNHILHMYYPKMNNTH